MKFATPEIAWHNRDPVFSVDIQPDKVSDSVYRLASAGADCHIVIWHIEYTGGNDARSKSNPRIEAVADLAHHQKAINVVKFSPSSEFLASGDDDCIIIIWKKKANSEIPVYEETDNENKEYWASVKTLRLHINDVCDIDWCPDSVHLISGSVDNTVTLWNTKTGASISTFKEHKGFVQGVAWDPLEKYVATLGSDRTLRVYSTTSRYIVCQCSKAVVPRLKNQQGESNTPNRLFHDDTFKSYFRRLCFSPDGLLLFAPSGILESLSNVAKTSADDLNKTNAAVTNVDDTIKTTNSNANSDGPCKMTNATFVFLRGNFNEPIMYYPSGDEYSIAISCCPVLFEKGGSSQSEIFDLPYKMVIAVATNKSVILYDTEHVTPFGYVTDIHYTRLTDISWSKDGLLLVVSSTDGFCTFISFENEELGKPWHKNTINENPDVEKNEKVDLNET